MSILDELEKQCNGFRDSKQFSLADIEKILGEKCNWKYADYSDNSYYDTSCGHAFQFSYGDGLLRDNKGFKYCPYCGREIQEQFEVKE